MRGVTLSLEEAMEYIGLAPNQKPAMYELCKLEGFPARKIGKYWRIHKRLLDEWLEARFKDDSIDYLY